MIADLHSVSPCPAIILARGGSKGIPKKNIMQFAGEPLLAWSILQARESGVVDSVYVSSDSDEILEVAGRYGAVAIKRPDEFSTDTSSSEVALLHVLDQIRRNCGMDPTRVIFLQATSPLREPSDIAGAVRAFDELNADSLFSDAILDDFCAWEADEDDKLVGATFDPWNRGRRQDRKPLFLENGSIYIFTPELLRKKGNRLGGKIGRYSMPYWKSFEIDTIENVELCEYYFRKHLLPYWKARRVRLLSMSYPKVSVSQTQALIAQLMQESISVKSALLADPAEIALVDRIATCVIEALTQGNKVMFCGNGGSFADSIHLAAEFVSRFQKERGPLAGIALGANNSILTAIGNDYSYAEVFARELTAIGQSGDILIGLSTSGNSENVLRAVAAAKIAGIKAFGITGASGGRLAEAVESLKVPSTNTARIQEAHILMGHILCELVENAMSASPSNLEKYGGVSPLVGPL